LLALEEVVMIFIEVTQKQPGFVCQGHLIEAEVRISRNYQNHDLICRIPNGGHREFAGRTVCVFQIIVVARHRANFDAFGLYDGDALKVAHFCSFMSLVFVF
jgi:hypothetical protein